MGKSNAGSTRHTQMNNQKAIQVSGLTKYYGETLAVDHISFEVEKGEVFGFLGPNGAGKTTTIRTITGLSKPTSGEVSVLGLEVSSKILEIKKHIGVVPEISNLYDELSAFDNLLFMAQLFGVPRSQRRKRVEALLKMFGLFERKNSLFRTLSRGMKRSLTIASALVHNPQILFLDEPTAGLDVLAAHSLRNLIHNLREQGITIFLTTHYLEEADFLCDRVAILLRGKILKVGTPDSLKAVAEEESIIEFSFKKGDYQFVEDLSQRLPELKIVPVEETKIRIYGGIPFFVFQSVLEFSKEKGLEVLSVNSIKPTLEDAFIKITGLSPTVMRVEKEKRTNAPG
ncbi:MAG: ABC transporter ATP-binding protein [Coprothermobacterota bacterium]|nr:ABC transporter ATP-binding protein [Coprothermobacterota bacterium]